jgi:quinol monooxygenase YgiN
VTEIGILYSFRVPVSADQAVETLLNEIVSVLEEEEFPSGEIKTFAAYRDPPNPGKWYVFQSLTPAAAERNFTNIGKFRMMEPSPETGKVSDRQRGPAEKLAALTAERAWRQVLDPVFVHGSSELVPNATERKPDLPTDVGAYFKFRIAPEHDAMMEKLMLDLVDVMKTDEYPTNDVMTYTLYRHRTEPGAWVMYEHFTKEGAARHATTPGIYMLGYEQLDKMIAPYERYVLEPVIVKGCGESVCRAGEKAR